MLPYVWLRLSLVNRQHNVREAVAFTVAVAVAASIVAAVLAATVVRSIAQPTADRYTVAAAARSVALSAVMAVASTEGLVDTADAEFQFAIKLLNRL